MGIHIITAAATAYCAKGSSLFISFSDRYAFGSNPFNCPAAFQGRYEASN
jgi:hypothetical protein